MYRWWHWGLERLSSLSNTDGGVGFKLLDLTLELESLTPLYSCFSLIIQHRTQCLPVEIILSILASSYSNGELLPLTLRGSNEGKSVVSHAKDFYFYMATYMVSSFYAVWLYEITTIKSSFASVLCRSNSSQKQVWTLSTLQTPKWNLFSFKLGSQEKKKFSMSNEQFCCGLLLRIRDCHISTWHGALCITQK